MTTEVVVPGFWLVLSHATVGVLGYYMAYLITCRTGELMSTKKGRLMPANPRISAFTILTVGVLVVIGIGFQQWTYQHAQDRHDACLTRWGGEVLSTLDTRAASRERLDNAREQVGEANAKVLLTTLGLFQDPPQTSSRQLLRDLRAFKAANADYYRVRTEADKAVEANPYPEPPALACD